MIPKTLNESWGFYGTMGENAADAWPLAMSAISDATAQPMDSVRCFLDSVQGRHFADSVMGEMHYGAVLSASIGAAAAKWMGWRIGRQASHNYGIPVGLPYLSGFVIHAEIEGGCHERQ